MTSFSCTKCNKVKGIMHNAQCTMRGRGKESCRAYRGAKRRRDLAIDQSALLFATLQGCIRSTASWRPYLASNVLRPSQSSQRHPIKSYCLQSPHYRVKTQSSTRSVRQDHSQIPKTSTYTAFVSRPERKMSSPSRTQRIH